MAHTVQWSLSYTSVPVFFHVYLEPIKMFVFFKLILSWKRAIVRREWSDFEFLLLSKENRTGQLLRYFLPLNDKFVFWYIILKFSQHLKILSNAKSRFINLNLLLCSILTIQYWWTSLYAKDKAQEILAYNEFAYNESNTKPNFGDRL